MHDNDLLPVPCYVIDRQFHVQSASQEAEKLFGSVTAFSALVDAASRAKLLEIIHPSSTQSPAELNLITARGELQLFDVYQRWSPEGKKGQLVCIPKDRQIEAVARQLHDIRELAARLPAPSARQPVPTRRTPTPCANCVCTSPPSATSSTCSALR